MSRHSPHPNKTRFWGSLFFLALCAGCAPRPPMPAEARNTQMNLTLEMTPRLPRSLDPTALTVRVTDAGGKAVSRATMLLRLDMPAMAMGQNEVKARETHAGVYVGTGRFTMAGAWRVTATASKGSERATQVFSVKAL